MFKKMMMALLIFTAAGSKAMAYSTSPLVDTTITVKIKGVTCNNDLNTLATNVKELKGVAACKPGKAGAVSVFKVTYNTALVSTKEIFAAFENTGGCSDPNEKPYKIKN